MKIDIFGVIELASLFEIHLAISHIIDEFPTGLSSASGLAYLHGSNPLNTWRNNNVVITSKRRHFDVITSKWRRFDVIATSLLRNVFAGNQHPALAGAWPWSRTDSEWHGVFKGPVDGKWRQRYGSTLAQVMACCLTAPSHYLNQCWFTISEVHWYSFEYNFTRDTSAISQ